MDKMVAAVRENRLLGVDGGELDVAATAVETGWDAEGATVDELRSRLAQLQAQNQNMLAVIFQHREETECCRECSIAATEDLSSADGRLWALLAG